MLDFIQHYFDQYRISPLIREVQAGCRILSYKSALDRLNALERKGLIRRTPNKHRGIKLLHRALQPEAPSAKPTAASLPDQTGEAVEAVA